MLSMITRGVIRKRRVEVEIQKRKIPFVILSSVDELRDNLQGLNPTTPSKTGKIEPNA